MKELLLVLFVVISVMVNAQNKYELGCVMKNRLSNNQVKPINKSFKAETIIWSEDFDRSKWISTVDFANGAFLHNSSAVLPSGWEIIDNTGNDFFWHWSDLGPRGAYTKGDDDDAFTPDQDILDEMPINSTVSKGFMMLESDYFNTTSLGTIVDDVQEMDAIIQYGPIDFTAHEGAIFNLNTLYRICCSANAQLSLEISSDYDPISKTGNWSVESINIKTNINEVTWETERQVSINVSSYVSGKSGVYFRLRQKSSSHYYWIIDDISFTAAPNNDLVLTDSWVEYNYNAQESGYEVSSDPAYNFWGGYTEIPKQVIGSFINYKAAVFANGIQNASNAKLTANILKNENVVETFNSETINITSLSKDTLQISAEFIPDEVGLYRVELITEMENPDEYPDNNSWEYSFKVTDQKRYSRVRHGMESNFQFAGPKDWKDGGNDFDVCAQRFTIPEVYESTNIKGINVYIDDYTNRDAEIAAISNGAFKMVAKLYKNVEGVGMEYTGINSNQYVLKISDTATWVSVDFVDNGNLNLSPGIYWAGVEVFTGSSDLHFQIGNDVNGVKQPNNGGMCYLTSMSTWIPTSDNYAIDLMLGSFKEDSVTVTFNINMTNANISETDLVYVTGSFCGWEEPGTGSTLLLMDADDDGIYSGIIDVHKNSSVEYKYFIGKGWSNGDPTDGGAENGDRSLEVNNDNIVINPADVWDDNGAPMVLFSADVTTIPANQSIYFTDNSTNNPTTWLWDFGDGNTSNEQNPSHSYSAEGFYSVALTATNGNGSNRKEKQNYITVTAEELAPLSQFTVDKTDVSVNEIINFTDNSLYEPTEWLWDFGDGSTSTFKNPSHVYTEAGIYSVSLTASNKNGSNTHSKSNYINVLTTQVKCENTENLFAVYPNITNGNIYITPPNELKYGFNIKLLNLRGQELHIYQESPKTIDISNCENGVYILYIASKNYVQIERLLLRK